MALAPTPCIPPHPAPLRQKNGWKLCNEAGAFINGIEPSSVPALGVRVLGCLRHLLLHPTTTAPLRPCSPQEGLGVQGWGAAGPRPHPCPGEVGWRVRARGGSRRGSRPRGAPGAAAPSSAPAPTRRMGKTFPRWRWRHWNRATTATTVASSPRGDAAGGVPGTAWQDDAQETPLLRDLLLISSADPCAPTLYPPPHNPPWLWGCRC